MIKSIGPSPAAINAILGNIDKTAERLNPKGKQLLVGVPADAGCEDNGIPLAKLAFVHEFGMAISHPGGTQYGYNTLQDAKEGKVRFQPTGSGHVSLGVTQPHIINVPERSFIRAPIAANLDKYRKAMDWFIARIGDGKMNSDQAMQQLGLMVVGDIQQAMSNGIAPPNTAATIRRKGSSTPLIDSGRLRQSVTFRLVDKGDDF